VAGRTIRKESEGGSSFMAIRIITDSSADISQEEARQLGISVALLRVIIDGKEYDDGVDLDVDDFYVKLREAKNLPTTSQPSPEQFLALFQEAKAAGDTVIAILISGVLSGTLQSAQIARDMADYPDIHIIDSETTIMGLRLLVELAVRMRDAGESAADIIAAVEEAKHRVFLVAMVDTLEYLVKGGRLSRTSGMVGTLLKIKPIITLTKSGVQVLGKARGFAAAKEYLLQEMQKAGEADPTMPIYFGYTADASLCDSFRAQAEATLKLCNVVTRGESVGCAIGTHAGPNAVVVVYLKKQA
jgi:DegV family protein with EDD domain